MARFFTRADILVSPRVKGVNTPMKIYSYLQSGKPVLATDLPTHTQVLDGTTALLAAPEPEAFAAAMLELVRNPALGRQLAERAAALAGEKYSWRAYQHTALQIYQQIENDVKRMSADAQRH
jgi:glycosyltransferase involved in cell wall biosynthesis